MNNENDYIIDIIQYLLYIMYFNQRGSFILWVFFRIHVIRRLKFIDTINESTCIHFFVQAITISFLCQCNLQRVHYSFILMI